MVPTSNPQRLRHRGPGWLGLVILAVGLLAGSRAGAGSEQEDPAASAFRGRNLTRAYTQRLAGATARVFEALSPVGEKAWAQGWAPEFLYCTEDCRGAATLFETTGASGAKTLWYLREYDPARLRLEYIIVRPGASWTVLAIQLSGAPDGDTLSRVTYTWTGLSPEGNRYVDHHATPAFDEYMALWERSLNHYLETGKPLSESSRLTRHGG